MPSVIFEDVALPVTLMDPEKVPFWNPVSFWLFPDSSSRPCSNGSPSYLPRHYVCGKAAGRAWHRMVAWLISAVGEGFTNHRLVLVV